MKKHSATRRALTFLIVAMLFGEVFAAESQQTTVIQEGHYLLYTEELLGATNGIGDFAKSGIPITVENGKVTVVASSSLQRLDGFSGSFERAGDQWLLTLRRRDDSILQFWRCLENGVFLVRSFPDSGLRQLAVLEGGAHRRYVEVLDRHPFEAHQGTERRIFDSQFELTVSRNWPTGNFEQDIRILIRLGQPFQVESWNGKSAVMRLSGTLERQVGTDNMFVIKKLGDPGDTVEMKLVLDKPSTFGIIQGPTWSAFLRRIENK